MNGSWIEMGTLARPHGIKGEFCIDWHADAPLLLETPLWLRQGSAPPRRVRPLAVRSHRGRPLLALEGVNDRTAAEALRGAALLVRREDLPPPAADETYLHDLLGCAVLLPDGDRLGRLDHVEYPGGQEVWSIRTGDEREVLFPARPEYILHLAPQIPAVTIDPPPGLLEIYLGA